MIELTEGLAAKTYMTHIVSYDMNFRKQYCVCYYQHNDLIY